MHRKWKIRYFLYSLLIAAPIAHVQSNPEMLLSYVKKVQRTAGNFQDLYTQPVTVEHPDTSLIDRTLLATTSKMKNLAISMPSKQLKIGLSFLLGFSSVLGFCLFNSITDKRIPFFMAIDPKNPRESIFSSWVTYASGVAFILSSIFTIWQSKKLQALNSSYDRLKEKCITLEEKKDTFKKNAQIMAETMRRAELHGFIDEINVLSQKIDQMTEGLPLLISKQSNLLKQAARNLKSTYRQIHPSYTLERPTEESLAETLLPQYKNVTFTTTTETEDDTSKGHNKSYAVGNNQQSSIHSNPQFQGQYPYYGNGQMNNGLSNQSNSAVVDSNLVNDNNHGYERKKSKMVTVEKRVLDEEHHRKATQRVKTFRELFQTLAKIDLICFTLRNKIIEHSSPDKLHKKA